MQESLDPVAAYDRLAPYYSHFSKRRAAYLHSVDQQIALRIPPGARSLLDIGAGDGRRAPQVASTAGISRVVLLEPSAKMLGETCSEYETWRTRVEELDVSATSERFDVITCVWNVLGHVQGFEKRLLAMSIAAQLLSPTGLFFADVIHRYNVRSYGAMMTSARWLYDHLVPSENNGDVVAHWPTTAGEISAYGHVFTDWEMRRLADAAGLQRLERIVIDYANGEIRRASCMGNLLYVFRRAS